MINVQNTLVCVVFFVLSLATVIGEPAAVTFTEQCEDDGEDLSQPCWVSAVR